MLIQATPSTKKLLVVIQYWDGDSEAAESLANLIADLERVPNKEADILVFGRHDAKDFSREAMRNLQSKFAAVHFQRCRRMNANGYPYGANEMFYDLVHLMAEPRWQQRYFGFINLESDCVPTSPTWINTLCKRAKLAFIDGKLAVGHVCNRPIEHLNGVAVYSTELLKVFGATAGGRANVAYDWLHAPKILPVAVDCPEIYLEFQRPTISAEALFSERKAGTIPAVFHGVKDSSARTAVRARYITLDKKQPDLSDLTVCTYFAPTELDRNEQLALVELWKQAWASRGWNPVVLGLREAMRWEGYERLNALASEFPTVNPKKYELACFHRWMALAQIGGGFMVDFDVVPGSFQPRDLQELRTSEDFNVLQGPKTNLVPSAVLAKRPALEKWLAAIGKYDATGQTHVSDQSLLQAIASEHAWIAARQMVLEYGEAGWAGAQLVHFAHGACSKVSPGATRLSLIRSYVQSH